MVGLIIIMAVVVVVLTTLLVVGQRRPSSRQRSGFEHQPGVDGGWPGSTPH
jgi:hypothetical protein